MDMQTWLQQATKVEREALASKVQSSVGYFYLIAGKHRRPGGGLCRTLVECEPKFNLWDLRPDLWDAPLNLSGSPRPELGSPESQRAQK